MKWFKHENTFNNPKIMLLTSRHGIEGFGVYFAILELLSEHIENNNSEEWGYLPETYSKYPEVLATQLHLDVEKLNDILKTCYEVKLFEEVNERLYCAKILERCDRYTDLLIKQKEHKNKKTVHKVVESTPRIEEKKNRKEKEQKKIEKITHSKIEELTEIDLQDIATDYQTTLPHVLSCLDDLKNYCDRTGKTYKDYKAALRNFVKKNAMERRENVASKSKITFIDPK